MPTAATPTVYPFRLTSFTNFGKQSIAAPQLLAPAPIDPVNRYQVLVTQLLVTKLLTTGGIMVRLTAFGREVRRLRSIRDESLRDMSRAVGVSPAFLSGVETGSKNLPADLLTRICQHFSLSKVESNKLEELAANSVRKVTMPMADSDEETREIAVAFARRFPQLTEKEKELIKDVLFNRT